MAFAKRVFPDPLGPVRSACGNGTPLAMQPSTRGRSDCRMAFCPMKPLKLAGGRGKSPFSSSDASSRQTDGPTSSLAPAKGRRSNHCGWAACDGYAPYDTPCNTGVVEAAGFRFFFVNATGVPWISQKPYPIGKEWLIASEKNCGNAGFGLIRRETVFENGGERKHSVRWQSL